VFRVLSAIKLNDQTTIGTTKVDYVRTNGMLTPELDATNLSSP
jgi:hypothetical protein